MSKKITRRALLAAAGGVAVTAALQGCGSEVNQVTAVPRLPNETPTPTPGPTPDSFPQLPVLRSQNGLLSTDMRIQMAQNQLNGQTITTRTYGGILGGPTLRVKPGDTLKFNIINELPPNEDENTDYPDHNTPNRYSTLNNHVHGLHVSPSDNSDNIFVEVKPGETFLYEYNLPSDHPSGTYWYHPHRHGAASEQMFGGMAGAIIIEGPIDEVPEIAAAEDLVFLFQEINIDPRTGQVPVFTPPANPFGDVFPVEQRTLIVNGQVNPTLRVKPGQVVRLRIINGCPETFLLMSLEEHPLYLLAWDGNTLPEVQETREAVQVAPGNRLDVLVKAGNPGTYRFRKEQNSFTYNRDEDIAFATMVVEGEAVSMALPTTLPVELRDIESSEIVGRRTITFAVGAVGGPLGPPPRPLPTFLRFSVNDELFDAERVDQTIRLGAVEEWTIQNTGTTSGHPFHIHVNPFQVISINGVPLPRPEWRDTIFIPQQDGDRPGSAVIRSRFETFTGLFVLHCHILAHEDIGMMQTVNVIP